MILLRNCARVIARLVPYLLLMLIAGPTGAFVQRCSAREKPARALARNAREARRDNKPRRLAASCPSRRLPRGGARGVGGRVGEAFINACASYLYCYVRNARVYLHARSADLTMHARDPARAISTSASPLPLVASSDLHAPHTCSRMQKSAAVP